MTKKARSRYRTIGRSDGPQYVNLGYPFFRSDAWRSLGGHAVKVWFELRIRFNGGNNGELHVSLEEGAQLLGMGKSSVARAFKELEAKGFITMVKKGHWYGRKATEWRTTDVPYNGSNPTHDYRKFIRPKKTKRGSKMGHIDIEYEPF